VRSVAAALLAVGACAPLNLRGGGPQLVISGPQSFVGAAYSRARQCGYRTIRRVVRSNGGKTADSELTRTDPTAECFGEWIATIPDATFAVAAPSVVY
jgi:hypothetical protein